MPKLVIGSLIGAVFMFLIGFLAYGTPLMELGYKSASLEQQLAIQSAMKGLPTGTYTIPDGHSPEGMAAYGVGPVAVVQLNSGGFVAYDPAVFAFGYLHMAVAAFLLGLLLWSVRDRVTDIATRMRVVIWASLVAVVFTRLEPIWFHSDWPNALYVALAEFISLVGAGYILARWFVPATPRAATA
jgi:hypothetical protein